MGGGGDGVQETADQVQEQKNNTELYNYVQTTYKPFLDKHIAKTVNDASSTASRKAAEGQVNAEIMKGVSANPTAGPIATTRSTTNAAGMESDARQEVAGKVRNRQLDSLQQIVDIGRGQETQANQMQGDLASQSVTTAIQDKQAEMQTQAQMENAVGSTIGAGVAAYRRMNMTPAALDSSNSYGVMQNNDQMPAFDQDYFADSRYAGPYAR